MRWPFIRASVCNNRRTWLISEVIIIGFASVIDGDTIRLGNLKIRLWGIDAPELHQSLGVPAKAFLEDTVAGKEIRCLPDGSISYDRVVAKCLVDGQDIGELIISAGHAKPYCKFSGDFYNQAAENGGVKQCVN